MSIKMSYVRKNRVYVNKNVLCEEKPCICQYKCLIGGKNLNIMPTKVIYKNIEIKLGWP